MNESMYYFTACAVAKFAIGVTAIYCCIVCSITLGLSTNDCVLGCIISVLSGIAFTSYDNYVCKLITGSISVHVPYVLRMCRKTLSVWKPVLALLVVCAMDYSVHVSLIAYFTVIAVILGVMSGYVTCLGRDMLFYQ